MMSAAVHNTEEFRVEAPQPLFEIPEDIHLSWRTYDVTADGQRFVMIQKDPFELRPLELVVVPNWITEFEARMTGTGLEVR